MASPCAGPCCKWELVAPHEARHLDIPLTNPVLRLESKWVAEKGGMPIEYCTTTCRADCHKYRVEFSASTHGLGDAEGVITRS